MNIETNNYRNSNAKLVDENESYKSNFKYNFIEYIFNFVFCKLSRNLKRKSQLLKGAESFLDYYTDIQIYTKKMMEIEQIKLFLIKEYKDLKIIDKFVPSLKLDYAVTFDSKVEAEYSNLIDKEGSDCLEESIKDLDLSNKELFNYMLTFY